MALTLWSMVMLLFFLEDHLDVVMFFSEDHLDVCVCWTLVPCHDTLLHPHSLTILTRVMKLQLEIDMERNLRKLK